MRLFLFSNVEGSADAQHSCQMRQSMRYKEDRINVEALAFRAESSLYGMIDVVVDNGKVGPLILLNEL